MKRESARALIWFSSILVLIGMMVMSPSAAFMLTVLGALSAAISAAFGARSVRIAGFVILAISLTLATSYYSGFRSEHERNRPHVKKSPAPVQAPAQRDK